MLDEAAAVPLILGLVEIIKGFGVPKKYLAPVAVVLGVLLALLVKGPTIDNGIIGLAIGLAASGLYSGGKAFIKK